MLLYLPIASLAQTYHILYLSFLPTVPDGPIVPIDPPDRSWIIIAVKGTAQFCIKQKLVAKQAKYAKREEEHFLMSSHHTSRSFYTADYDACFTPLGLQLNQLISNSWDETIYNAHYAIEQLMDHCVRTLVQSKSFIDTVPAGEWDDPSSSLLEEVVHRFTSNRLRAVTVGLW